MGVCVCVCERERERHLCFIFFLKFIVKPMLMGPLPSYSLQISDLMAGHSWQSMAARYVVQNSFAVNLSYWPSTFQEFLIIILRTCFLFSAWLVIKFFSLYFF
jgi:hypothetical protein